jgi:hypothetical protein
MRRMNGASMETRRASAIAIACSVVSGCASRAPSPLSSPAAACGPDVPAPEGLAATIVLLGETHGTAELPALFGRLVCQAATRGRGRPVVVGLEIWTSAQGAIDSFLGGPGGPAARRALIEHEFWGRDFQDGRSSGAMVDLLEELRRQRASGLELIVRAVDPPKYDSPTDRDARMAAAVVQAVEAHAPVQTLLLVGDVHSRPLPGYPWDPAAAYLSLGARLRQKYGDVVGLRALSGGGSAWMCLSRPEGAPVCAVHPIRAREIAGETPRIELDPGALEKTGWSGTVFLAALTASPPVRPAP